MPDLQAERQLRAMIARLKNLASGDFDAVLDGLDDEQRGRVVALLAALEGADGLEHQTESLVTAFDPVVLPPDLSSWLVARINGRGDAGDETADQFEMTAFAHQALRHTAASFVPQPARRRHSTSLLGRFWKAMA